MEDTVTQGPNAVICLIALICKPPQSVVHRLNWLCWFKVCDKNLRQFIIKIRTLLQSYLCKCLIDYICDNIMCPNFTLD